MVHKKFNLLGAEGELLWKYSNIIRTPSSEGILKVYPSSALTGLLEENIFHDTLRRSKNRAWIMTTDVTLIKSEVTWTVWKEEYGWRYGWQAACRGSSRYAPEAVYAPITDDQHEDIRSSPQSHRPIDQWLHGNHWLLGKCVYYSAGEWLLEVGVPKTLLQLLWLPVPITRSLHGRR